MKEASILALGFLFFGVSVGAVAGVSVASGISQALLTSLFTFVGGVLLTYGGFKVRSRVSSADQPGPELDARRVGAGLAAFSIGLLSGLAGGIAIRISYNTDRLERILGTPPYAAKTATISQEALTKLVTASLVELQSEAAGDACSSVLDDWRQTGFEGDQGRKVAVEHLRVLCKLPSRR